MMTADKEKNSNGVGKKTWKEFVVNFSAASASDAGRLSLFTRFDSDNQEEKTSLSSVNLVLICWTLNTFSQTWMDTHILTLFLECLLFLKQIQNNPLGLQTNLAFFVPYFLPESLCLLS